MLKKITVCCVIFVLLLLSIPTISSDSILLKSNDENNSNEALNRDGLADNVSIGIKDPIISIQGIEIFWITLAYKSSYKIYYELFVNVTKNNGSKTLFEDKLEGEMHGSQLSSSFWWKYRRFLFNGHPFGHFDINVTLRVTNDGSINIRTAHGYIYFFYIIPWAVIEKNG